MNDLPAPDFPKISPSPLAETAQRQCVKVMHDATPYDASHINSEITTANINARLRKLSAQVQQLEERIDKLIQLLEARDARTYEDNSRGI